MGEVIKWGQFGDEYILLAEYKYGLVQTEHDGRVCAKIGRRHGEPTPRKTRPYFEDYYHTMWCCNVEEAKRWVEYQLQVTVT